MIFKNKKDFLKPISFFEDETHMIFHKGSSKNWFATAKLREAEPE